MVAVPLSGRSSYSIDLLHVALHLKESTGVRIESHTGACPISEDLSFYTVHDPYCAVAQNEHCLGQKC